MVKKFGNYVCFVMLLLAMSACENDKVIHIENEFISPYFEVTFSGDASGTSEGLASYFELLNLDTGKNLLLMHMTNETGSTTLTFATGLPIYSSGTYPISILAFKELDINDDWFYDTDYFVSWFTWQINDKPVTVYSEEGSITIEAKHFNRIIGSFNYNAVGFNPDLEGDDLNLQLTGSFNAVYFNPFEEGDEGN